MAMTMTDITSPTINPEFFASGAGVVIGLPVVV